jgi:5-methylcytosine-specific restriction protein A
MPTIKLLKTKDVRVPTTKKKEYQAIYQDRRWRRLRDLKKKNNPICERCENEKRTTPVDEVHHIVPFDWGRTPDEVERLAYDYDNLLSVCTDCHDKIHDIMVKQNFREKWEKKNDLHTY